MSIYLLKYKHRQRFKLTHKKLRTENRLLKKRVQYLENESSALADKLIREQVDLAQQEEKSLNISHELTTLRDVNKRLEEEYATIKEQNLKKGLDACIQVDDKSMIEHIHSLQEELMDTHNRKADLENTIRELKTRINELECANKRLKESPPDGGIANIQEELIRVKMREAEASLSLKEMRQRVSELEQHWNKYINQRSTSSGQANINDQTNLELNNSQTNPQISPSSNSSNNQQNGITKGRFAKLTALIAGNSNDDGQINIRELEDQLMGLRIKEADAVAELKEMRQKVMELETQNQLYTNQLKRQDEELKKTKEEKELAIVNEQKATDLLKNEKRKLLELESEMKEKNFMERLKYTESLQQIADLKQTIAHLESNIAEKNAQARLRGGSIILDIDNESMTSHRSQSFDDTNSIASDDMSAFIADVTVNESKHFENSKQSNEISINPE